MIPANFEYHRPADLKSALGLMDQFGDEARVVAGGHSLIPMMKMRLTEIGHLVDLQDIAALKGITIGADSVTLGAMTTQHEMISHAGLTKAVPILREAALQIADPQVRYMGTIGGNVANGDPGNDMPGLMQCLNATFELAGPDGKRSVAARDFYQAAYFTSREENEILTAVTIPVPAAGTGYAYAKQKRKIGDYATAAAAVLIGKTSASVAMTNLADTPIWSEAAGTALAAGKIDACVAAMLDAINPQDDMRGPVAFKKHVAAVVLRRAIDSALARRS